MHPTTETLLQDKSLRFSIVAEVDGDEMTAMARPISDPTGIYVARCVAVAAIANELQHIDPIVVCRNGESAASVPALRKELEETRMAHRAALAEYEMVRVDLRNAQADLERERTASEDLRQELRLIAEAEKSADAQLANEVSARERLEQTVKELRAGRDLRLPLPTPTPTPAATWMPVPVAEGSYWYWNGHPGTPVRLCQIRQDGGYTESGCPATAGYYMLIHVPPKPC